MTQKFISRQKSQSPTTSPPVQTSRFANRPFAEPVQQKAQQPDLQTILQRAERTGNPTAKMAWGNTQPEVQRQGVTENEIEESKVQKEAATDTQSQDLEEQKDTEVQTQLDSTIQSQESEQKPEEETIQQQSSPEEEQKDTEVQSKLDSTIQQQESEQKPEEETVQKQSTPEEEQKDTDVQTQLDSTIQQQESEQKPEEETIQQQESPEEEQKDTEVQTQLDSTIQQQESSQKPEEETVQQQESSQKPEEETVQKQSTPEEEQKNSEVQTKLTVGQPGDKYEQEADNVAAKVMTMPETKTEENTPQSQDVEKEESTVQKQPIAQSITSVQRRLESSVNLKSVRDNKAGKAQVTPSLENRLASEKGGGSLLPEDTRSFMESRFGADFSEVRVHTDSQAAQMNQELGAQAFTHGNDIYFNSGKYDPSSGKGQELLAHELTHTIQQTGGKTAKSNNNSNNKKSSKANKVQMKSMTPLAEPTIQRREETSSEAVQTVPTPSTVEGGTSDLPEATGGETAPSEQTPASSGSTPPSEGGGASSSGSSSIESQLSAELGEVELQTNSPAVQMCPGTQNCTHGNDSQQKGLVQTKQQTPSEDKDKANSTQTDSPNNEETQVVDTAGGTQTKTKPNNSPETEAKQSSPAKNENAPQASQRGLQPQQEKDTNPTKEALQAVDPKQEVQLPQKAQAKENKAQGGNQTKGKEGTGKGAEKGGKTLKDVPEAQALKEATADREKASSNLEGEGNKKATNPETEAEKEQSVADAQKATTKLESTNAEVTQLASMGIKFALPEPQATGEGEKGTVIARKADPSGNSALLEQQRAQADAQASDFLAQAAERVQTITGLGESIPERILAAAENAKAGVMAAVEQQKAVVTAQIVQLRSQAQSEAQAAIAQIQAKYQATAAAIPQTTANARQEIDSEQNTALQTLDEKVDNQTTHIEEVYNQAGEKYRDAGARIGDEALARAEERAKEYESKITGKDDNFWDGPLTDNRNRARANAAREVGKEYKQGLIDEANKQADQVQEGKSKDIETVLQIADQSRETLKNHHQASLESLDTAEQQVLSQVEETQTSLTEAANESLQATLQSLDQQQASQLQLLAGYGERQISVIDRDAQKAIASLQDGVNQAATSLQNALQESQAQLQGIPAPNPDELSAALAEVLGQFDNSVTKVQQQTEQGIAASEQGIAQGGQQVVSGVSTLAQTGLQESMTVVEAAKTTLTNLNQGATDYFNQTQEAFSTTVTDITNSAVQGFNEVTQGIETTFEEVNQNLESGIEKGVSELEEGLRGAFDQMEADIDKYAEEAAAKEEPRGVKVLKGIAKALLVVAVIAVAIVVAPVAIGAVGAVAGALGASAAVASGIGMVVGGAIVGAAAGAVVQMGNNLIDGKPIFEDIGKAVLAGAIGGALGGAGGALGNVLGAAGKLGTGLTQSTAKFGIDVGFDVAGTIAGDLAVGNPITLEGVLIGAGIGAAVHISTENLNKLGKFGQNIEGMQTQSSQVGEQLGTSLGNKIKSGFGGGVDAPPTRDLDVNMPSSKSPETEVKAPETGGKAPETSVKSPQTEVKVPETQVKPPEIDTPNGRTTHKDEPEVEPGVVAKEQMPDGHEIKVLKDGRVVRCSDCQEMDVDPKTEQTSNPQEKLQEAKEAVRIIRQDNDFAALVNHKGKPKSHVAEDGSLVPANPKGSATPLEHVYGSDPAKGDSPYTSFLTEKGGVAKTYGDSEVELDLPQLRADIQSGQLKDVEILTPEQISSAIKSEIDQIATVDINAAIAKGPQGIPEYVASLKISKKKASKLERRLLAYYNTTRDGEYLVKGTIPPTYLNGPYSAKAPDTDVKAPGTQVKTPESELPSGTRSGVDKPSNTQPDADAGTPHGLKSDSDLPMTTKEQEILKNTAPKRGDELTSEELNTELELAGKAESRSINEGEFVEEIKLPNDHEWKQKEDGTWCRFSGKGYCIPPGGQQRRSNRTATRMSTLSSTQGTVDRQSRTRGATRRTTELNELGVQPPRRNLQRQPYQQDIEGTQLWDGISRPAWGDDFEDNYWQNSRHQPNQQHQRREYECIVGPNNQRQYLPRKKDARPGEDIATIGHITQWRDHINNNADGDTFTVEDDAQIWAISRNEAETWYRDPNNLQPEGQIYNSQRARSYTSDPLHQQYVDRE
ncbi:DUF4157 domain-containing protein [Capilliphycus salinus ALCB114379]|uniref:eCIS core domain-containing protein n=1 Tax=Capilliphycus salinus TaxID=2768948 RepID=UPI0039A766EA